MGVEYGTPPQDVYDALVGLRKKLILRQDARKDRLNENDKYVEICEKGTKLREQKKAIEIDYDSKNPALAQQIEGLKDDVAAHETTLMGHALDAVRKGKKFELVKTTRSGKQKKITVSFKPIFGQLTLF